MKVGTTAETNEKKKKTIFVIILITVFSAIVFSNLLQLLIIFIVWLFKLIIEHYIKILVGIAAILIGRKILFRAKKK